MDLLATMNSTFSYISTYMSMMLSAGNTTLSNVISPRITMDTHSQCIKIAICMFSGTVMSFTCMGCIFQKATQVEQD